ncbi:MAG: transporter [Rhodanobacter denitrificans]|uniref:Transporter n=1 Tax=Rhodanobacter denitrificans TaxID=666685 RepID=A0A2W5KS00_9GAMM|nr:MAG: transporter [Rhodanobacter denitrificans]
MRLPKRSWAMLMLGLAGASASRAAESVPLDFAGAQRRLLAVSDAMQALRARVDGKQQLENASHHLRWPEVSGEMQRVQVRKTLELSLGSLAPVAADYGIQSPLRFVDEQWHTRPTISAVVPIYSGGAIPAQQQLARSAVKQAGAELALQEQSLLPDLVQAYFGQQLAQQVLAVRRDALEGLAQHLDDTRKLENQGFATKAQRLQAEVARDHADRDYQKAVNDYASVQASLALLLRSDQTIDTTSALFVNRHALDDVVDYEAAALAHHPQVARLEALVEQARAGVSLQRSKLKPQMYAFGQYDLHRSDALLTQPDWAVGVALKYTFLSGTGRLQQVGAARAQQDEAEASLEEARNQISIGVNRAFNDVDAARKQFLLLESSIERALENLRLQSLSFQNGRSTSLDVIDARVSLATARVERARAAYEYDVALARLLQITGQTVRYQTFIASAEPVHAS